LTLSALAAKPRLPPLAKPLPWALLGVLLWLLLTGAAALAAWRIAEQRAFIRLGDVALHQLDLYASVLEIELGKQADLPGLIDTDGEVQALLQAPRDELRVASMNRRLTRFVARSGALSATVVDARGMVHASSAWYLPDSPLGHLAPNEPCVGEALAGREVLRFAANPLSGAPEVCFGRPVLRAGTTLGVVVLRVSLEPIEATWVDAAFRAESEKPLVVDSQGIVIMSSVPAWKTRPLGALAETVSAPETGVELVRLRGEEGAKAGLQLVHSRPLPRFGWKLLVLSNARPATREARAAAWGAVAALSCAGLLLALWLQRRRVAAQKLAARAALQRAHDELELKVRHRTAQLETSNRELRREVREREHAEQVLRQAQEELLQAERLALLGQLSAGITHELGQPLTALRALADNGRLLLERGRLAQAGDNFGAITGLAERMGRITAQLKSFARKSPSAATRSVRVHEAVDAACELLSSRLAAEQVSLRAQVPADLCVPCDRHRLEQVLVNLVANAVDALRGRESDKQVAVLCRQDPTRPGRVLVQVSDNGPGVPPHVAERLFEPFFTTKPPGEGLGLGLVISSHIVHEFGGTLHALPAAHGALFEIDLPEAEAAVAQHHV
jgi:two-component system C4-dicarboxylate transport sensor histidine kinase DctB